MNAEIRAWDRLCERLPDNKTPHTSARSQVRGISQSFVVGIAGGTGAGKTTIANLVCSRYSNLGVSVIDQDSYYRDQSHLREEARRSVNYDDPAVIDHDLLFVHLARLISGAAVTKPKYCFATHSRTSAFELLHPARLILLEGIFALWDTRIRSLMDLRVFVDAPADIRFIRRLQRDLRERGRCVESVIRQYLDSVRPMHYAYIEPTKAYADMVVHDEQTQLQLIMLLDKATARLTTVT